MKTKIIELVSGLFVAAQLFAQTPSPDTPAAFSLPIATGPFQPSWESLTNFDCPEWFRDAKFGIWAHWSAQCVPEQGDWYARSMYMEGSGDYRHQVAHYGHPSKVGFKDIDRDWHAENWNPEKLIALYKRAGAKYFMALANHHDNFDCWNSKYQPWNTVNVGPRRDIVGEWAKAARHAGLRFGVSVHASHAWNWFEVAQGADTNGPLEGVPYDGKLTKADGRGQWWDGLDPQDLYAQNHAPGTNFDWSFDPAKGSSTPDAAYCLKFFNRVKDLVDSYRPDLLYFDDRVLPFELVNPAYGLSLAAHLYNASTRWHGRNESVMTCKDLNPLQRQALVYDIERGKAADILPFPWQTDTCIGSWHYQRSLLEKHRYKTAATVIQMLVDIVSKNGNLMLSIPLRGDGTIDYDEITCLEGIARWMDLNSECIFGTRPWKRFGEGPSVGNEEAGQFGGLKDAGGAAYSTEDIRFTTRGETLYAIALDWPTNGQLVVRSLAKIPGADSANKINKITLLGYSGKLEWAQTTNGLAVKVPTQRISDPACALRINGRNLAPAPAYPRPPSAE
jgi:alpha-L-fucosidase